MSVVAASGWRRRVRISPLLKGSGTSRSDETVKLLLGFILACAVLLGVFVWHTVARRAPVAPRPVSDNVVVSSDGEPDGPTASPEPAIAPALEVASLPTTAPSDSGTPTSVWTGGLVEEPVPASQPPTSRSAVRWAGESRREAARARLAAARGKLHEDPNHDRALQDELAALLDLERWGEAADTLARLARLRPEDIGLRSDQASLLIRARRWVDAVDVLRVLVAERDDDAHAWFNLAVAHQALGHLADARRAWDRTIALSPTALAYAQRGAVLLDQHEWEAAAADFTSVLRDEPDARDAMLNLALALGKLGRRDEARRRLVGWLDGHPRDIPALNRLANLAWGEWQASPTDANRHWCAETADWCRRSLDVDPDQPPVREMLDAAERAARDGGNQ